MRFTLLSLAIFALAGTSLAKTAAEHTAAKTETGAAVEPTSDAGYDDFSGDTSAVDGSALPSATANEEQYSPTDAGFGSSPTDDFSDYDYGATEPEEVIHDPDEESFLYRLYNITQCDHKATNNTGWPRLNVQPEIGFFGLCENANQSVYMRRWQRVEFEFLSNRIPEISIYCQKNCRADDTSLYKPTDKTCVEESPDCPGGIGSFFVSTPPKVTKEQKKEDEKWLKERRKERKKEKYETSTSLARQSKQLYTTSLRSWKSYTKTATSTTKSKPKKTKAPKPADEADEW